MFRNFVGVRMPFKFQKIAPFDEVVLVEPQRLGSPEAWVIELTRRTDFVEAGLPGDFAQENVVRSPRNHVRGLHFKLPGHEEEKLIRCAKGRVLDVLVDIRPASPTFGRHATIVLEEGYGQELFVPKGFAHGYVTLSDASELVIKRTKEHSAGSEGGLLWNDPDLAIPWPVADPTISPKDAAWPRARDVLPLRK